MKGKRLRTGRVVVTAAVIVAAVCAGLNFSPMLSMKPLDTGPIPGTDILALRSGTVNMFLLPTSDGYIVIDAGKNKAAVQSGLSKLNVSPLDITGVLLTHSDYDHTAALSLFKNARICMSGDELQMVDHTTKRNAFSRNSLPDKIDTAKVNLLADGQELAIGGHIIRCIQAPGHTLGSMIYLVDGQYLFSGDAVQVKNDALKTHPYTMDKAGALESLQMIKGMLSAGCLVFTAHYGYYAGESLK